MKSMKSIKREREDIMLTCTHRCVGGIPTLRQDGASDVRAYLGLTGHGAPLVALGGGVQKRVVGVEVGGR
jgi:hypothetical protein